MNASEKVGPQTLSSLQERVERIIAEARRQGASDCEVSVSAGQGLSTTVRQREVETVEFNRDQGFGITLFVGQRKGSASTSAMDDEAIRETVAAALAIARHASEDECAGLAAPELMARELPDLDLYHPWDIEPEQAVELALRCEAAAFAHDPRIRNADGTSLSSYLGCRVYGNSHGFVGGYASSRHSLSCVMIAEGDGQMQRDYWYDASRIGSELADGAVIGRRAAERAVSRLGARAVPTCEVPVLFAPELATGLFNHFLAAIAGGVHNLFITHGDEDQAALLRRMGRGLLVTELMGQGLNLVTGDYARGAGGYWVENGEIQFPVQEVTIAGNLRDMFQQIVAIGSDLEMRGTIRTGSVLIEKMTVAGC